jgi:hypothetical protein
MRIRIRKRGPNQCGYMRIRILVRLCCNKKLIFVMKNIVHVGTVICKKTCLRTVGTKAI